MERLNPYTTWLTKRRVWISTLSDGVTCQRRCIFLKDKKLKTKKQKKISKKIDRFWAIGLDFSISFPSNGKKEFFIPQEDGDLDQEMNE